MHYFNNVVWKKMLSIFIVSFALIIVSMIMTVFIYLLTEVVRQKVGNFVDVYSYIGVIVIEIALFILFRKNIRSLSVSFNNILFFVVSLLLSYVGIWILILFISDALSLSNKMGYLGKILIGLQLIHLMIIIVFFIIYGLVEIFGSISIIKKYFSGE